MDKRQSSPSFHADNPPAKTRRTARACLNCRSRKQKCAASSVGGGQQAPCSRCQQLKLRCSFEIETFPEHGMSASPSKIVEYIIQLQQRLDSHEERLAVLERTTGTSAAHECNDIESLGFEDNESDLLPNAPQPSSPARGRASEEHDFNMSHVVLESPFATLRSMGAVTTSRSSGNATTDAAHGHAAVNCCQQDPIIAGVLTVQEAKRAIELFFEHFHPHAPFINETAGKDLVSMRHNSPATFLGICSISARFWERDEGQQQSHKAHSRISELFALFDLCISRFLLRPNTSDVNLDTVQALLLYIQWMPFNMSSGSTSRGPPTSRYNDISAWTVLGLAARYAKLLRTNQETAIPRQDVEDEEDFPRLRIYYNLISCDFNLMLSSGLPVSIDPTSTQQDMLRLIETSGSQLPGDLRIVALIELVSLTYQTLVRCGDFTGRKLDLRSLKSLNVGIDNWETTWMSKLAHTTSQHVQLPFTSMRWYRLTLNSAPLAPLLSKKSTKPQQSQLLLLQALERSLTAASQIVLSYAKNAGQWIWEIDSQLLSSFPKGYFELDTEASDRMQYAVDSSWISYSFSITFLVLCFVRQVVDEDLQLRIMQPESSSTNLYPPTPQPHSIICRLMRLVLDVCNQVEHFSPFCPGRNFRRIIVQAASMLGVTNKVDNAGMTEDETNMQSILDLIHESGFEFGMENDIGNAWFV